MTASESKKCSTSVDKQSGQAPLITFNSEGVSFYDLLILPGAAGLIATPTCFNFPAVDSTVRCHENFLITSGIETIRK